MSADPRVSTEAAVARLSAQMEGIGREIGQMRREIADKLGDLAQDVADTKAQAKITNGRVTAHDREIDVGHGGNAANAARVSGNNTGGAGVTTATWGTPINDTGGGQAHENRPPYVDMLPAIRAY